MLTSARDMPTHAACALAMSFTALPPLAASTGTSRTCQEKRALEHMLTTRESRGQGSKSEPTVSGRAMKEEPQVSVRP